MKPARSRGGWHPRTTKSRAKSPFPLYAPGSPATYKERECSLGVSPRSGDRPVPARARADPLVHCPGPLVSGRGPEALEVTRRQLLKAAAAASFASRAASWAVRPPAAFPQVSSDPASVATLEALPAPLIA